ncbi:MAG: hypothetical protein JNJ89_08995 [Rubrivivax sp.]|nr:hypothetical protein [Rubrivivax sp.]
MREALIIGRPAVRLRLQPRPTVLEFEGRALATLPLGPQGMAEDVLLHDPTTGAELERAIDLVEDALTGLRLGPPGGRRFVTSDGLLLALPGLGVQGAGLTRDGVEMLFQRLASRTSGAPVAVAELPHGREISAALLILRECMHHLDVDRVDVLQG